MTVILRRLVLVALTAANAVTGGWAYGAPRHWYENFPGMGRSWLPQLGPFNEHMAKDAGAMFLALAVLGLIALWRVESTVFVQAIGLVLLTFNVLHLIYHMRHLHVYGDLDKALNVIVLVLLVALSAALLAPERTRRAVAAHR
ncbi:hypothetical protein GCM10023194_29900 [Planotetraspora phitsanulokensis]|uniref:Uncharacterized protein n=1 Tax=Planotetraspora phitsanulokensis TaxID=575192 RepID=A0A8J3XC90_9ACTN|nr:hypothetical protein [Planotetraspora phitsanulokensis]GII35872.1 hypothetical protein Pph01_08750 [Planotetraspora phitsanulokensis]